MEQITQAVQPGKNPDYVRIVCPLFCQLHGFGQNERVATTRRTILNKDANGLDIWVHSTRWNRSVWVASSEYSLS